MSRGPTQAPTSRPIGDYAPHLRKPSEYYQRHHQQPSRLPTLLETTYQDDSGYGNSVPSSRIFNSYEFPADTYRPSSLSPRLNATKILPQSPGHGRLVDQRVQFQSRSIFPDHEESRIANPTRYAGLLAIKNSTQIPIRTQFPLEQTWPPEGPLHASRRYQPLSLDVRAPRPSRHRREVSFADELEVELPPRAKSFQESAVPSIWRDASGTISARTRIDVPTFATHYRYLSRGDDPLHNGGYFQPAELGLPLLQPQHANRRINVNLNEARRIPREVSERFMAQPQSMHDSYHEGVSPGSSRSTAKEDHRVRQHPHQDFLPGYRVVDSSPVSTLLSPSNALLDLSSVDQFALFEISTSALGWAEMFMGASWLDQTQQYKFVVLDRHEELLYIGVEESSCISDCVVSPYRSSFKVRILDASGRDVIQFHRVYPVKPIRAFGFGQKRKYRLEVSSPPGQVIGNVEKTFDSDNYYLLEDRTGETVFLVQRSCICTCPIFWDYEFKVLLPESDAEVGDVSWSYLSAHDEQLNGTEISFPVDLDANSKIMLLGACFLLNFGRWPSSYLESIYSPRKNGKSRRESTHQGRKEDRPV